MKLGVDKQSGKFYKTDEGRTVEIPASEYYHLQMSKDVGGPETALRNYAHSGMNLAETFGADFGRDEQYTRQLESINEHNPWSALLGDIAPYISPVRTMAGNAFMGGAQGAGYADQGNEVFDGTFGAVSGVVGHMAGRIVERLSKALPWTSSAYKEPLLSTPQTIKGERGWYESALANTTQGAGPANLFARENQIRLNQVAADALGIDGRNVRRFDPATLQRTAEDALAKIDEVNAKVREPFDPLDVHAEATLKGKLRTPMKDVVTSQVIEDSITDGNIDPAKFLVNLRKQKARLMEEKGWSEYFANKALSGLDKVKDRVDTLTDPKLGAYFNPSTRAEEVISDVGRGLLPGTGMLSFANFIPEMAPIGKGGTVGGMSGRGLLTAMEHYADDLGEDLGYWALDENRDWWDKTKDVGEYSYKTGKKLALGYPIKKGAAGLLHKLSKDRLYGNR